MRKLKPISNMRFFNRFTLLICLGVVAGCSNPAPRHDSQVDDSIQLTATMPSRYDVALSWQDMSKISAGHIIEFATAEDGPYTPLGFWPANETSYTHPRLIPDTTFFYRARPYVGPASAPADISLPAELSDAEYAARYAKPEDYSWGAPERIPAQIVADRKSIRDAHTAAAAAPTGLKAVIAPQTVSGVHLTWVNHDSDAEGYLIEMKSGNDSEYKVCAVVEPKINSFGWSLCPPERKASFRVRAYYFGKPSNLVSEKTGPESEVNYAIH
jgi:hypothetical protein